MTLERSYVVAPRWSGLRRGVEDIAYLSDVEMVSIEEDKGFLLSTVYYTVKGSDDTVASFRRVMAQSITEYNAR